MYPTLNPVTNLDNKRVLMTWVRGGGGSYRAGIFIGSRGARADEKIALRLWPRVGPGTGRRPAVKFRNLIIGIPQSFAGWLGTATQNRCDENPTCIVCTLTLLGALGFIFFVRWALGCSRYIYIQIDWLPGLRLNF